MHGRRLGDLTGNVIGTFHVSSRFKIAAIRKCESNRKCSEENDWGFDFHLNFDFRHAKCNFLFYTPERVFAMPPRISVGAAPVLFLAIPTLASFGWLFFICIDT